MSGPLAVEPWGPDAWRVPGREEPFYRVEIRGAVARCSCKGWEFRYRCRHLELVWEHLRLAPVAPVPVGPAFDRDALPPEPPASDDDAVADDEPPAVVDEVAPQPSALAPDALVLAIDEETGAVLDRCAGTLAQLERRATAALQPSEVMRKYRAARERLAAERAHEAA